MDGEAEKYFNRIIDLAKKSLQSVKIVEYDISYRRAFLKIKANHKGFDVRITEVLDKDGRKYSYYLLRGGKVILGFDNAPDIRALKAKYGSQFRNHFGENVPHRHGKKKETINLTAEMEFTDFLNEIRNILIEF
jgi:hypothetical protein